MATGNLQVEKTSAYCTVNCWSSGKYLPTVQHEVPSPRFEPMASDVGGESSTTTPPSSPIITVGMTDG